MAEISATASPKITLDILETAYKRASQSIKMSQSAHKSAHDSIPSMNIDANSFNEVFILYKNYLTPFSQHENTPLDPLPIREQVNLLMQGQLPLEDNEFDEYELEMLMILVILSDLDGKPLEESDGNSAKSRVMTLALLLKFFWGAHRGIGYRSAAWALKVAKNLGTATLTGKLLAQKGFSQGEKKDLSMQRILQDLQDLQLFQSSLHWLANKMLAYEVVCSDARYRPLSFAIKISKAMAEMLFLDSGFTLEMAEMLYSIPFSTTELHSEVVSAVNMSEWKAHYNTSQLFVGKSKRARHSDPEGELGTQM